MSARSARPTSDITFAPPADGEQLADLVKFVKERDPRFTRLFLSGSGSGERVELPEVVYQALTQIIEAMRSGSDVSIVATEKTLTSQQAADILGISRPTLNKLLTRGEIPYTLAGTHRRIPARPLLECRDRRREAQYAALEATSGDYGDEPDEEAVLAELARVRRAVGARRRRHTSSQ